MITCEQCGGSAKPGPDGQPRRVALTDRHAVPVCSAACADVLEAEHRETLATKDRQREEAIAAHAARKEEKEKLAAERAVRAAASAAREAAKRRREEEALRKEEELNG